MGVLASPTARVGRAVPPEPRPDPRRGFHAALQDQPIVVHEDDAVADLRVERRVVLTRAVEMRQRTTLSGPTSFGSYMKCLRAG